MKIAVFCSSTEDVSPMLLSETESLGEWLAKAGHTVVYGGANMGCMGALARGVLRHGGALVGVIPEMDFMQGLVQPGLTDQRVVPTLSARKEGMIEVSDAFLVLPGGIGTLDEAIEVLALRSLGTVTKPIIFYNFLGIWTPFIEAMELLYQQRLIRQPLRELLQIADKREDLEECLKNV